MPRRATSTLWNKRLDALDHATRDGITKAFIARELGCDPSNFSQVLRRHASNSRYIERLDAWLVARGYLEPEQPQSAPGTLTQRLQRFPSLAARHPKAHEDPHNYTHQTCPACNRPVPWYTPAGRIWYCPHDATPLAATCPKCNTPNDPETSYCRQCGHHLTPTPNPTPPPKK